ncbi:hypothetical protein CRYUN_Cryun11dG0078300 [Craigia yunnanensis]
MCLIVIRNSFPHFLQDIGIKTKLLHILLELLDDPGQVGDEAPFAFSSLIAQKEDLQKLALEADAIDKLHHHLQKGSLHPRRYKGILLALADMCSKLESCRSKFLSLQPSAASSPLGDAAVLDLVTDALTDDSSDVHAAGCICLKSVTRSIKNLSAGYFMKEIIVIPLVQVFLDPSASVQVAALGAISNIVVDFTTNKSIFVQCGGMKQLVQLAKSMESAVRSNALWALKNFVILADNRLKEGVFLELTASLISSLICDPEPSVQVQALALVRNLVNGFINSIEFVSAEDGLILGAIGRQLQSASKAEIRIGFKENNERNFATLIVGWLDVNKLPEHVHGSSRENNLSAKSRKRLWTGMYSLCNVVSGNEFHKEAVMHQLFSQMGDKNQSFMIKVLQSNDSQLRKATVWTVVNLTCPSSPGAFGRFENCATLG